MLRHPNGPFGSRRKIPFARHSEKKRRQSEDVWCLSRNLYGFSRKLNGFSRDLYGSSRDLWCVFKVFMVFAGFCLAFLVIF